MLINQLVKYILYINLYKWLQGGIIILGRYYRGVFYALKRKN